MSKREQEIGNENGLESRGPDRPASAGPESNSLKALPRYDWRQDYEWNYHHTPAPLDPQQTAVLGRWNFCGIPVPSPLGIPAGPLLNGAWARYYASLGFDVLTYKTVRTRTRACYAMPNLLPVLSSSLSGATDRVPASDEITGSWAVSFGMPSRSPEVWRLDVERTRQSLDPAKILVVSVVATPEPHWDLEAIADDFALAAVWAIESGADVVEANFSCPNVSSADGQLFQQSDAARHVAQKIRQTIGSKPLVLKIGHVTDRSQATQLMAAVAPFANALAMVNCIAATVVDRGGGTCFEGARRGIAGAAVLNAAQDQVRLFSDVNRQLGLNLQLIGVGGISRAGDVLNYLDAGAQGVQIATAAMLNPGIALAIREDLALAAHASVRTSQS